MSPKLCLLTGMGVNGPWFLGDRWLPGGIEVLPFHPHSCGFLPAAVHSSRQEEVIDHRLTEREWAEEWKHLNNVRTTV